MQKLIDQGFAILVGLLSLMWGSLSVAGTAPTDTSTVTVYRCVDAKGKVSLQDSSCAKTSQQETREMLRPKDAPRKKNTSSKPRAVVTPAMPVQSFIALDPPPVLYQCTDYEGKTRDSENYDPNPRCEPLWALGYHEEYLPIEQRGMRCRWIQDSCVRYEGEALCARWKVKKTQAQSDVRYAFSDTSAYRKSELARITQIVNNNCP